MLHVGTQRMYILNVSSPYHGWLLYQIWTKSTLSVPGYHSKHQENLKNIATSNLAQGQKLITVQIWTKSPHSALRYHNKHPIFKNYSNLAKPNFILLVCISGPWYQIMVPLWRKFIQPSWRNVWGWTDGQINQAHFYIYIPLCRDFTGDMKLRN